jgi:hypothetical protein
MLGNGRHAYSGRTTVAVVLANPERPHHSDENIVRRSVGIFAEMWQLPGPGVHLTDYLAQGGGGVLRAHDGDRGVFNSFNCEAVPV